MNKNNIIYGEKKNTKEAQHGHFFKSDKTPAKRVLSRVVVHVLRKHRYHNRGVGTYSGDNRE